MMRSVESLQVGAALVARIDLGQDIVLISAPADRIATLERVFLSARRSSEALAAIRRRVDVEPSVAQFRAASP